MNSTGWSGLRTLALEKAVRITVQGECMTPELQPGSVVAVQRKRWYLPGDILAFRGRDGRLLAHRLIGWRWWRGGWHLVTFADNALHPDPPLLPHGVLGRVAHPVPWSHRLQALARFTRLVAGRLRRGFLRAG